ncbi:substrate-binding periplasmic protein [Pseudobacteriovorax antillogorgiicola]|nr:transporter substrate-binding domain-containing protein [Pseudobacteriovorax antillogorgiicola]
MLLFPNVVYSQACSKSKTLQIGVDPWPPFSYSSSSKLKGVSVDIIRAAFSKVGIKTDFHLLPWKRIVRNIQLGELDVLANLYYVEDIAKWVKYSLPYLKSDVKLASLKNFKRRIRSISSIQGESVAYGQGYSFGKSFDHASHFKKVEVPVTENGLKMMILGRVDLVIDSEEVLSFLIDHNTEYSSKIKILSDSLLVNEMSIGVSKKHRDRERIITCFNQGLTA